MAEADRWTLVLNRHDETGSVGLFNKFAVQDETSLPAPSTTPQTSTRLRHFSASGHDVIGWGSKILNFFFFFFLHDQSHEPLSLKALCACGTLISFSVVDETSRLENKICAQYQMHMQWNHLYTSIIFWVPKHETYFWTTIPIIISQVWILNQQKTFCTAELVICSLFDLLMMMITRWSIIIF